MLTPPAYGLITFLILSLVLPLLEARLALLPTVPLSPSHNLTRPNPKSTNSSATDLINKNQTVGTDDGDECTKRKQSPELWNKLKMNDYLKNYPGGEALSLKDYAVAVGANNFNLKIGGHCRLDQLCEEVKGKDWYALVAAQRWNIRMNQAFDAIGFASTAATEISQAMTFDFIPAPTKAWMYASTIISATFWVILAIPSIWFGPVGRYWYRGILSVFYATTAVIRPIANFVHPTASHAFSQWSELALLISQIKKNAQEALANLTDEVYSAGISTDEGLYGLNLDGRLFAQHGMVTESEIQTHFDEAFRLQILSHVWQMQGVFIIRGSQPCNGDGENGALTGKDVISYCSPDGIMMNIVRAEKHKLKTDIFGADQALSKHGFTAESLTTSAWKCQESLGRVVEPNAWQKASEKDNEILLSKDCKFVLPVCDLTGADMKAQFKKGKNIIKFCKKLASSSI